MASVGDKSEGSGALSLENSWSLLIVNDLIREERKEFRVEHEQADAALHVERSEAGTV